MTTQGQCSVLSGAKGQAAKEQQLEALVASIPTKVKGKLTAALGRSYIVIVWEERVYSGTVSFPTDGVAYITGYTYTLEVPRAGGVKPGICTL